MVRRWWIVILFFCESYIYDAAKNLEIKYEYIRNVWIKSRNVLRNNQKLIIKNINYWIRQRIKTKEEFYLYVELFTSREILSQ